MPNHVRPVDVIEAAINAGVMKSHMPIPDMIIRGLYAGFFLGLTASFNFQLTAITGNALAGGLTGLLPSFFFLLSSFCKGLLALFFAGFMMIIFYGFELCTGNMLVIPLALLARRAPWFGAMKNLVIVFISNFLGCVNRFQCLLWMLPKGN